MRFRNVGDSGRGQSFMPGVPWPEGLGVLCAAAVETLVLGCVGGLLPVGSGFAALRPSFLPGSVGINITGCLRFKQVKLTG